MYNKLHFAPVLDLKKKTSPDSSPGVSEYLSTEICTSRQKRFSLVTFVDSPGLVDGDMKYPFDVDEVILWLGQWVYRNFPSFSIAQEQLRGYQ